MRGGFWAELFVVLAGESAGRLAGRAGRPADARPRLGAQGDDRAARGGRRGLPDAAGAGGRAARTTASAWRSWSWTGPPGGPALSGLDDGLSPAAVPRLLRQVPDLLATSMARLHALDPDLVRGELEQVRDVPVTVPGLLAALARFAGEFGRTDLVDAARWLADHPPGPAPDVICHGDLHPFNLLADGDRVTVLDWSTALLAPRAHDAGFTSLLLSEPAAARAWLAAAAGPGVRPGAGPPVPPRLPAPDGGHGRPRRAALAPGGRLPARADRGGQLGARGHGRRARRASMADQRAGLRPAAHAA